MFTKTQILSDIMHECVLRVFMINCLSGNIDREFEFAILLAEMQPLYQRHWRMVTACIISCKCVCVNSFGSRPRYEMTSHCAVLLSRGISVFLRNAILINAHASDIIVPTLPVYYSIIIV